MIGKRKGFVLWFTGLSGAGKSTLAETLSPRLRELGLNIEVLDGDEIRTNLSEGLGFSKEDRDTNIRRIGYVARLLARNNVGVISAAISPYEATRKEICKLVETEGIEFIEVFAKCPIAVLSDRDVKGLYEKAVAGELKNFTGVSDPYEPPRSPDVVVETDSETIEQSAEKILSELSRRGLLNEFAQEKGQV